MGIDYDAIAAAGGIPKGPLRVEAKRERRVDNDKAERECRAETKRLYGLKCVIPGCKESAPVHQHHVVFRSRSRALKYDPRNRRPVCQVHHDLIHAGKIAMHFADDGELLVTGDRKYLEFKL